MSDYRDPLYRDPNNPMRNAGYEPAAPRGAGWGWIAGAVFLVIILALAFGLGHEPSSRIASNTATPPSAAHPIGPPSNPATPPATPGLAPPPAPAPAPTTTPTPNQ